MKTSLDILEEKLGIETTDYLRKECRETDYDHATIALLESDFHVYYRYGSRSGSTTFRSRREAYAWLKHNSILEGKLFPL